MRHGELIGNLVDHVTAATQDTKQDTTKQDTAKTGIWYDRRARPQVFRLRQRPAKAKRWSRRLRSTSTRWRPRASTSSPSTTTSPAATPNGWGRSTISSG